MGHPEAGMARLFFGEGGGTSNWQRDAEASVMLRLILLIVIVMALVGALPTWPYSTGWGYYPTGGLGTILLILLILMLLGVI
jgi:hypothetical protein